MKATMAPSKVSPEIPAPEEEVDPSTGESLVRIALSHLADLSHFPRPRLSVTSIPTIDLEDRENVSIDRYLCFFTAFAKNSNRGVHDVISEETFAARAYEARRTAFAKASVLLAIATGILAGLAASHEQWLRLVLLLAVVFPIYFVYIAIAARKNAYSRMKELALVTLLGMQGLAVSFAEIGRPTPTYGMVCVHMAFVFNLSPIRTGSIHFCITLFCSLFAYMIQIPLRPSLRFIDAVADEGCGDILKLSDILLPPIMFLCMFGLSTSRDEKMRRDMLMRERVRAQRRKLKKEVQKGEDLLQSMLPAQIIDTLKKHEPVEPELFEEVTVIFVQVCNFSKLCAHLEPETVLEILDLVYLELDRLSDLLCVHKIETVGDVYMAVVGCPQEIANNPDVAAHFALAAQASMRKISESQFCQSKLNPVVDKVDADGVKLEVRIGLNTGGITAGVVGLDKPRFKLVGDAVNVSSRMESTCDAGGIQMTQATRDRLTCGTFEIEDHGNISVKGKGDMRTFYLKGYAQETHDTAGHPDQITPAHSIGVVMKRSMSFASPKSSKQGHFGFQSLTRSSGRAMRSLIASMPFLDDTEFMTHDSMRRNSATGTKYWKGFIAGIDRWWLLVPSDQATPEMLQSLREDKASYLSSTLQMRMSRAQHLIIMWQIIFGALTILDYKYLDIAAMRRSLIADGCMLRTWGVQLVGWVHMYLVMDKHRFANCRGTITAVMLSLQTLGVVAVSATMFGNELVIYVIFGLYVLLSTACALQLRVLICSAILIAYMALEHLRCAEGVDRHAWERMESAAGLFVIVAIVLRMNEHLEHSADYYKRNVETKITRIEQTKRGTSSLLASLLPPHVVELVSNNVSPIAERYSDVTVVFTDIKGFTTYSSRISPEELFETLNSMYAAFDEIILRWGLHKVEVIGDAYFISAGCPDNSETPDGNAMRAVEVALAMLRTLPAVCDDATVQMRVGLHTGDVIAGVVGKKGPRFQLFGRAVEFANFMESSGTPGRCHISNATYQWLAKGGHDYEFEQSTVEFENEQHHTWFVNRSKSKLAWRMRADMITSKTSVSNVSNAMTGASSE